MSGATSFKQLDAELFDTSKTDDVSRIAEHQGAARPVRWHGLDEVEYASTGSFDSQLVEDTISKESVDKGDKAMYREKLIVRSIFSLSVAMSVVGITLLGGTTVGFAMFFSGGILSYECYLLLREF